MKKALIWKEEKEGRVVGQVERVDEAEKIDAVNGNLYNYMEKVEVPQDLEDLSIQYLEGVFVEETEEVGAHWAVQKKDGTDDILRNNKLDSLRQKRVPLLEEADKEINKLEDKGESTSSWRSYRQALREATDVYKDVDGKAKDTIDSVDMDNISWPAKPE